MCFQSFAQVIPTFPDVSLGISISSMDRYTAEYCQEGGSSPPAMLPEWHCTFSLCLANVQAILLWQIISKPKFSHFGCGFPHQTHGSFQDIALYTENPKCYLKLLPFQMNKRLRSQLYSKRQTSKGNTCEIWTSYPHHSELTVFWHHILPS